MSVVSRVLAFGMTLLIGTSDPRALVERPDVPLATAIGGAVRDVCDGVRRANPPVEITPPLEQPVRVVIKAGVLYLPRGFRAEGGAFDLVVHFHGSADMLGPAMEKLGIHAALYAENRGISSSAYEWPYADDASLERILDAVKQTIVAKGIVDKPVVRRVALSAWSAGHGAVYRLLGHPAIADRVDAVLLEDALHAAFKQPATREIDDVKMAPFVRFGAEAAKGKKLLALTHSSIPTFQFASTTETATYLADALGTPRQEVHLTRAGHMTETSSADLGDFHLQGFEGMSKEAHCDHFRGIDDTVLGYLAARWSQPSR